MLLKGIFKITEYRNVMKFESFISILIVFINRVNDVSLLDVKNYKTNKFRN